MFSRFFKIVGDLSAFLSKKVIIQNNEPPPSTTIHILLSRKNTKHPPNHFLQQLPPIQHQLPIKDVQDCPPIRNSTQPESA